MNKLKEILAIQSYSYDQFKMFAYLIRTLKSLEIPYFVDDGCIYATKGDAKKYPCIVAHMDTVHQICEDLTVIEIKGKLTGFNAVTMSQTGIGGDDKVGIFIALEVLKMTENIKVVFFRDEEVGCEGSYNANTEFFNNCNIILQCDRKGNKDFIRNASGIELSSKKFQKEVNPIIKKYGYSFNNGMMTDVMALKELEINASMANISCGYYNPHCKNEYVIIKDVENCLNMVLEIINTLKGNYDHKNKVKYSKKYWHKDNYNDSFWIKKGWDDEKNTYLEFNKKEKNVCECCSEIAETTFNSIYNIDMCKKCINDYVTHEADFNEF